MRYIILILTALVCAFAAPAASAMTTSKAYGYSVNYAENKCEGLSGCQYDADANHCEWLYSGHARCHAWFDWRSAGTLWRDSTDFYVYWVDDGSGGAYRYNKPTAWRTDPWIVN